MSGGYYRYFYLKLIEFAEEVESDAKDTTSTISPAMRDKMQNFHKEILDMAVKARALEWFLSSDTLEQEAYNALTQS